MDVSRENIIGDIFFGLKGGNNLFIAQAFAILTKDGPDKFRLLRKLIVDYSLEIPPVGYDHKKVENISKSLIGLTASAPESTSWLELFVEPFDENTATMAVEKIRDKATHYYTLGFVLGLFQASNWLDDKMIKNVLAEKIPETLAKIIFCLNNLTDNFQIPDAYESELSKALKPFLYGPLGSETKTARISMLMESIHYQITVYKNTSRIGQMIIEQLDYAIFGSLNFTARIDALVMYWKEFTQNRPQS